VMSPSMCYVCDVAHQERCVLVCREERTVCDITHVTHRGRHHTWNTSRKMCDITHVATSFSMCYVCDVAHHASFPENCRISVVLCRTSFLMCYRCYLAHLFRRVTCVMSHIVLPSLHTNTHLSWCIMSHMFLDVSCHKHLSRRGTRVILHMVPPSQHTATHLSWSVMSHICLPTSHIYHEVSHVSYCTSLFLPYTLSHIFFLS